ncbi:MAG TPA: dTDP-4-keto-6-deoxy-D-glucose epimerase [Candidatus Pelagibacter sp.]|jgi:dTDP-4-dehydrorhamnose 3,5-epimerase|nr:dTDP-4-keto-6-deoxy-D-glucose epimerase [Candidatus Pelagibacter sp.]
MKVIKTKFKDLYIIKQIKHVDNRGNLRETYRKNIIKWNSLIFDYVTTSKKNVLRGFHFQSKYKQAKFVSVVKGKILDCVIDLRKSSKTFGKSFSIILSDENCLSLYVPESFAHSYYTYTDSIIYYKLSNYYQSKYEDGLLWNDKTLKVKWPNVKAKLSKKDKNLKSFSEFKKTYKYL